MGGGVGALAGGRVIQEYRRSHEVLMRREMTEADCREG